MNTVSTTRAAGFSLIELMVAVLILGILVSLAVPSFQAWLLNAEIRNEADSILSGLQRARSEALTRNMNVQFDLAADGSWEVKETASGTSITKASHKEGAANVAFRTTPPNKTTVIFNNVGGRVVNAATDFTDITIYSSILGEADSHQLKVVVGASGIGGTVRMCDPSIIHGPRAC